MQDNNEKTTKAIKINWFIIGSILVIVASAILIAISSRTTLKSFNQAVEAEKEKTSQKMHDVAYDYAEEEYHVSNDMTIIMTDIQEKASLEVLQVTDTEVVIEKDDKNGIEEWYEFSGKGVYTVDLKNAEYIVDNKHKTVTVRIASPELTNVTIVDEETEKLFSANKGGNDTYSDGVTLEINAKKEGEKLIKNEFNKKIYFEKAQESAEQTIAGLVYEFNPNVTDINVIVEFV